MKKNTYEYPKSSFLSIPKDTALIMEKILSNKKILKLLYYTSRDWESKPNLTAEQIKSLFDNQQISNIPKIFIAKEKLSYLRVTYNNFRPNEENPFYRDHIVQFKIICHFDDWDLDNYESRPYRIAGELDAMFNGCHLSGIGKFTFITGDQDVYDPEYGGITLQYLAVQGNEDKVNPLE